MRPTLLVVLLLFALGLGIRPKADRPLCPPQCLTLENKDAGNISSKIKSLPAEISSTCKSKILLCGDVKTHPGPSPSVSNATNAKGSRKVSCPCSVCGRGVTKASKAVSCDTCERWTHVRCSSRVTLTQYDECVKSGGEIDFTCDYCGWASLPFFRDDIEDAADAAGAGAAPASTPQVPVSSCFTSCIIPKTLTSKGLHFLHSNARSLLPKISEVQLLLSRTRASVFAVTETWLDSSVNDGEITVPGFSVVRQDRNRHGDGVALYVRNEIAFNPRPDLSVDDLEATWVELLLPRSKGILVCSCYRPPSDSNFLNKLEQALAKIDPGTELYILGDINIDFNNKTSPLFKSYLRVLDFFGCSQLIAEPTRMTDSTSSILDHVIVSDKNKVTESGVICAGLSDHLVTFCSKGPVRDVPAMANIRKMRSFRSYSPWKLRDELGRLNWSSVLLSTDVDYCLGEFIRLFNSAIEVVAPSRDVRVKNRSSPWMNPHILSGIRMRDSLLSRFKKDRSNQALYREFCKIRNAVQRDIKVAKQSYFRSKVEENRGNAGKLWGHLKSLGYSSKSSGSSNIVLEQHDRKIYDPFIVASIFNNFYTKVAGDLVAKLPSPSGIYGTTSRMFRDFYRRFSGPRNSFTLSPVSRHFVLGQLKSLDPKKAIGLDGISSQFLRDGAEAIVEPVSHIVNISILTETVPSSFKQAKVIPLFKKGSKLDPSNYRPVSILSVLSKVLERAVHGQLGAYLEKNSILYKNQSGFRGHYSTDTCLIGLSDFIKGEIGKGNLVGMVLIDLQKAFDTVNHEILLSKM